MKLGGGKVIPLLGTDNRPQRTDYCFLESKKYPFLLSHRRKFIIIVSTSTGLKKTMATAFSPQSMLRLYRNVLRIHKRVLPQV